MALSGVLLLCGVSLEAKGEAYASERGRLRDERDQLQARVNALESKARDADAESGVDQGDQHDERGTVPQPVGENEGGGVR